MKTPILLIAFTFCHLALFSAQNSALQTFLPASASRFSERFDPNLIAVEDPNTVIYAELPSGDVNLKSYSAPFSIIQRYSLRHGVSGGDIKDFALAPNCTRAEIDALKRWTTNDIYPAVNKALRFAQKGKVNGVEVDEKTELEALVIASAINCIPSFQGAVNRVETAPSIILDQYKTGNLLIFRGFTSTTKGNEPPPSITGAKQHILIPNAVGGDIDALQISQWPIEKEVLIRPGTVFKVTNRVDVAPAPFFNILTFSQVH